jgi:hypothetical protein
MIGQWTLYRGGGDFAGGGGDGSNGFNGHLGFEPVFEESVV